VLGLPADGAVKLLVRGLVEVIHNVLVLLLRDEDGHAALRLLLEILVGGLDRVEVALGTGHLALDGDLLALVAAGVGGGKEAQGHNQYEQQGTVLPHTNPSLRAPGRCDPTTPPGGPARSFPRRV